MKILFRLVIISLSLGICLSVFSADTISKVTYKWTDANGFVQYTERPPVNRDYEIITVTASGGKEVTNISADEATNENADTTANTTANTLDEVIKSNERNCKIAKQNMEVLSKITRIRVTDEKGENRILSPEEKQVRVGETQKQIDTFCK
ncbi:MAG: DUF4124 domain-containing protein [Gammaproteobacteria bacterium]|nr:DUF4124 domain-containing protein [Gammaproteobacteria bacterium]